jgi:hypothetical protein
MTEVIVKARLITWFRNEQSAVNPDETVRMEKINHIGEKVDIDDEVSFQRLTDLDAIFTPEESEAVEEGTYTGPGAAAVYAARGETVAPEPLIEPAEGEGRQVDNLSAEELAEHIKSNRLTVEETVALAGDDADSINKVLDAENIATDNDPRKGVEVALEAKLAAAQG